MQGSWAMTVKVALAITVLVGCQLPVSQVTEDGTNEPVQTPTLVVSVDEMDFGLAQNERTFEIENAGDGSLIWSVESSAAWLEPSASAGTTRDETDTVVVTADRSRLEPGRQHEATIRVDSELGGSTEIIAYIHQPEGGFIIGHVFFAGTRIPISGVTVSIAGKSDTTEADGAFQIEGVSVGEVEITAAKPSFDPYTAQTEIRVEGGVHDVELTGGDVRSLSGVLTDPLGRPIAGASVSVLNPDQSPSTLIDTTDASGSYQIPSIPQGQRELRFEAANFVSRTGSTYLFASDKTYDFQLEPVPLYEPDAVTAEAVSDTSIQVSWGDRSSNELGYRVLRKEAGTMATELVATLPEDSTDFVDSGLTPFELYEYSVVAFNDYEIAESDPRAAPRARTRPLPVEFDGFFALGRLETDFPESSQYVYAGMDLEVESSGEVHIVYRDADNLSCCPKGRMVYRRRNGGIWSRHEAPFDYEYFHPVDLEIGPMGGTVLLVYSRYPTLDLRLLEWTNNAWSQRATVPFLDAVTNDAIEIDSSGLVHVVGSEFWSSAQLENGAWQGGLVYWRESPVGEFHNANSETLIAAADVKQVSSSAWIAGASIELDADDLATVGFRLLSRSGSKFEQSIGFLREDADAWTVPQYVLDGHESRPSSDWPLATHISRGGASIGFSSGLVGQSANASEFALITSGTALFSVDGRLGEAHPIRWAAGDGAIDHNGVYYSIAQDSGGHIYIFRFDGGAFASIPVEPLSPWPGTHVGMIADARVSIDEPGKLHALLWVTGDGNPNDAGALYHVELDLEEFELY